MKGELSFILLNEQPVPIAYYEPVFKESDDHQPSDFEIFYCNKAFGELADRTPEELTGQKILEVTDVNENIKAVLFAQLKQVYASGEKIEHEYFNPLLKRHFHVIRNKVQNGVLTLARDISKEVLLRQEKEKQTELANRILNNSLDGWFYCDTIRNEKGEVEDFMFVRINPGFTSLIGLSEKEVIGKTHLSLFPAARENGVHEMNCRVVNQKVTERKQMHYKGDNIDAWYDIVVSPLGEDGLLVTFADITRTKQKEIEAAKLAETLTTVFNTVHVGIFTFKPEYDAKGKIVDFRFTMVNPTLSSYVAQEPEALIGSLGSEWFPGYLQNGVFDMYLEAYLTNTMLRKQFHYAVDGIDVYLDLQATRIGDEVLVTFSDFTPLQLSQLELQKSIRELQRTNQNLEELTRAASHDLKEPIRKIQLFSDRLKHTLKDRMDDNAKDLFDRMHTAAARMRSLIDDLLEYSQINTGKYEMEKIDLNEVIAQVISDLEIMIEENEAVVEKDELPVVFGYRRQLQQLFLNLISNSIKYRKQRVNPHIFIHASIVKGQEAGLDIPAADDDIEFTMIEVNDNGIGFEPADSERIFNVFTRLHNNKEYTGTGIGLAIATRVMENHNGYIFAKGVKGQGATFTLLFPRS